jgi:hypothetical protein
VLLGPQLGHGVNLNAPAFFNSQRVAAKPRLNESRGAVHDPPRIAIPPGSWPWQGASRPAQPAVTLTRLLRTCVSRSDHRSLAKSASDGARRAKGCSPCATDGTLGTGLTSTSTGVSTARLTATRIFRVIACIALKSPLRGGHAAARKKRDRGVFHRELRGRRPKGLPDCRLHRTMPAAWWRCWSIHPKPAVRSPKQPTPSQRPTAVRDSVTRHR